MAMHTKFELEGGDIAAIQQILRVLPRRLRNGAMRRAGRQAADIVRRNVQPLVPVQKHPANKYGPFQNKAKNRYISLREGIVSKVRTYSNAVFVIVGPRTKANLRHASLIEYGTKPRFAGRSLSSSEYTTRRVKERVGRGGDFKYRYEKVKRDDPTVVRGMNRGAGPAFHYMSRGWAQARPGVIATIEAELRKALSTSGVTV